MIVRNGRREREDWGPYQGGFAISDMKMSAGAGTTGTGRWSNLMMTVVPRAPRAKRVYVYPLVTLDEPCAADDCSNPIVTRQPTLAIYCSDRCRARLAKRRSDARKKAARDA